MQRRIGRHREIVTGVIVGCLMLGASYAMVEAFAWVESAHMTRVRPMQVVVVLGILVPLMVGYGWLCERRSRRVTTRARSESRLEVSMFKDELIGHVSHELRTPLTGIVGYAHLLEESALGGSDADAVSAILAQSAELSRLLDDRLTAARIETGTLSLRFEPVSIRQQAQEAAGFLNLLGTSVDLDCQDAMVWVDAQRLRQALRNLLVNAHHHGRPQIVIQGHVREDRYILQVIDQGVGIPHEMEGRLFKRAQGDPAPRVSGSVGLGLAVVEELCRRMGSSVSYRHIRGKTHFIVSLPLHEPCPPETGTDSSNRGGYQTQRVKMAA